MWPRDVGTQRYSNVGRRVDQHVSIVGGMRHLLVPGAPGCVLCYQGVSVVYGMSHDRKLEEVRKASGLLEGRDGTVQYAAIPRSRSWAFNKEYNIEMAA